MSGETVAVTVNGEARELAAGTTLAQLLEALDVSTRRCAVEVNRQIVPKATLPERVAQAGDVVEIVSFVGGG